MSGTLTEGWSILLGVIYADDSHLCCFSQQRPPLTHCVKLVENVVIHSDCITVPLNQGLNHMLKYRV